LNQYMFNKPGDKKLNVNESTSSVSSKPAF
jgi:hypothetical protein